MNKKLFMSVGMLVFAAAVVAGGTGAFFTDTETSAGNTFAAGSVDVSVGQFGHNYTGGGVAPDQPTFTTFENGTRFTLSDLKPLDTGEITFAAENNANPAYVCTTVEASGNAENDRLDPEVDAGDNTPNIGELQDFLSFKYGTETGTLSEIAGMMYFGSGNGVETNGTEAGSLEYCFGEYDESGACVLSSDDDNVAQTDSVDIDLTFQAVQTRNNENFSCADLNEDDGEDNNEEEIVFSQNFEDGTEDWTGFNGGELTRVADGTDGIPSSEGDFMAFADGQVFTQWGGYSSTFPAEGYTTEVDVYLDMDESDGSSDAHFDYTSAVNDTTGTHRRDFVLSVGHDPVTGDWSATASNNAGAGTPHLNAGNDPVQITTTGWYTLQHYFYDNGSGELAVDMKIIDSNGVVVGSWTRSDASDVIGSTVGGNRYGWFATQPFSAVPFDNSVLYLGAPN